MHDSFTPLGGLVPMWLMQLGEVVFGGVGSGLYGMLMFAVVAVFIAGLMVGRTPEYLGKKIEAYEVKMASIVLLVPPAVVLVGTAIAVVVPAATASVAIPAAHGFSEILYAFSSAGNNNGSAFAGLSANTPFYNFALGVAMWASRYWLMIPVLAIAGSLAAKRARRSRPARCRRTRRCSWSCWSPWCCSSARSRSCRRSRSDRSSNTSSCMEEMTMNMHCIDRNMPGATALTRPIVVQRQSRIPSPSSIRASRSATR